ncbi:hypothetical protein [Microbacterium sp. B24]|uniref:hypothetical protein n=1 Tax=Microbacterium sp. B24 TaxID=95616 RepID=UPI000426E5AD|nr:hypothetical protein [Microbacterium sp. B24]
MTSAVIIRQAISSLSNAQLRDLVDKSVAADPNFVERQLATVLRPDPGTSEAPAVVIDADGDLWYRADDGLYTMTEGAAVGSESLDELRDQYAPVRVYVEGPVL